MKSALKNHRWPVRLLIIGVVLLTLLTGAVIVVRRTYEDNLGPVSKLETQKLVTVPQGASVQEIAQDLKEAGLIKQTWAFEWYVRSHDLRDSLKAGTYSFSPSQGIPEIAGIIAKGEVATDLVTIIPGKRIDQIRAAFINSGFKPSDVDEALKPENYANHPALVDKPAGGNLEGYLYPESFQKTAETTPKEIIKASLDEMQKRLTPTVRAGISKQGLTVYEGITLASIIEKEVSKPSDKTVAAQVFLRRLKGGMKLESNVTIIYGAVLLNQENPGLNLDSPYNTYLHTGLTPGPISNVTDSSLQAVANPAPTDYLFFVAGDDGNTYFSKTAAEHQEQIKKYCHVKCQQL